MIAYATLNAFMAMVGVVLLADLIVGPILGRWLKRLAAEQVREIHTPSQLTHRQPGSISERSGKGDEAAFHNPTDATEVGR